MNYKRRVSFEENDESVKRGCLNHEIDPQPHIYEADSSPFRSKRTRKGLIKETVSSFNQPTFTLAQVVQIVKSAVAKKEVEIREEYDQILVERLQEQWESFSQYSRDNIHQLNKERAYNSYFG